MDFRVIERDRLDIEAWDNLMRHGSFFHTAPWADICTEGILSKSRSVFLCGFDDKRLMAGMPALIGSRMGLKSFYSMLDGTYGAPVFDPDCPADVRNAYLNILAGYLKQRKFSKIVICDFKGVLEGWNVAGMNRTRHFTHVVSLENFEDYRPHKKIEYDIRAGEKTGAEIVKITGLPDVERFYVLYQLTRSRHEGNGPHRDKNFFMTIFNLLGGSDKLYWTGLMAEGKMVGSQIHFIHGDTLFNWQTVSDYEMRQYKPSQVLMYDAIRKAAADGLQWVNLGASPHDALGLIKYKERWQGKKVEYDILTAKSGIRKLLGR